jgi:hypothetical protein
MAMLMTILHQNAGVESSGEPPVQTNHANLAKKVLKLVHWCPLAIAKLKSIIVGP